MKNKKNKLVPLITGLLVLGFVIALITIRFSGKYDSDLLKAKELPKLDILTTFLEEPVASTAFSLKNHLNENFTQEKLRGKWSFLFFGYINCPDICPNTMAVLNKVFENLSKTNDLGNTAFIFSTVDPQRDTVKSMAEYVAYFNKDFIGLIGEKEEIDQITKAMNIAYILEESSNNEYQVGHSTAILLIDPKGRQVARFSDHQNAEEISGDFRKIRQYFE
ncbi:MAG: SCO family protein [Proteobacteria bacterium]|nr:SCO family protein [Pseudomonadota bacterium]